jgi:hypothetical protein
MRRLLASVIVSMAAVALAACGSPVTTAGPSATGVPPSASATPTAPSATPTRVHPEGWRRIPAAPTGLGLVNVWTGQLVLASPQGCCQNMDGEFIYAYRPSTQTWRAMPRYPLGERLGSAFVWTDSELIQVGGSREIPNADGPWLLKPTRNGMALDPQTRQWRRIADAPGEVPTTVVAWTGEAAIFADGTSLLRYDPSSDEWATGTPMPGVERYSPAVVWTGREVVVWGGSVVVSGKHTGGLMSLRDGYAYRPDRDTWRLLPAAPIGAWGSIGVWDGHEVLVWGGSATRNHGAEEFPQQEGAAYDPATNSWRQLPRAPIGRYDTYRLVGAWTGREFVVYTPRGGGAAYRPKTDQWRALPPGPTRWLGDLDAVWTERSLVLLPGSFGRRAWEYFPGY